MSYYNKLQSQLWVFDNRCPCWTRITELIKSAQGQIEFPYLGIQSRSHGVMRGIHSPSWSSKSIIEWRHAVCWYDLAALSPAASPVFPLSLWVSPLCLHGFFSFTHSVLYRLPFISLVIFAPCPLFIINFFLPLWFLSYPPKTFYNHFPQQP